MTEDRERRRNPRVQVQVRMEVADPETGRIYHAKGIERQVRSDPWHGRTPERFSDALEWLCSWKVDHCLAD